MHAQNDGQISVSQELLQEQWPAPGFVAGHPPESTTSHMHGCCFSDVC
jgi:hypothetical protein